MWACMFFHTLNHNVFSKGSVRGCNCKMILFSTMGKHLAGLLVAAGLLMVNYCSAQNDKTTPNKYQLSVAFAIARSTFEVQDIASPKYPSLELRSGLSISRSIGNRFELKAGYYAGMKIKRDSYFYGPDNQFTHEPGAIPGLDEAASDRNHWVSDIPLQVLFKPLRSRITWMAGLNARFWAPGNNQVDVLTGLHEFGVLSGVRYQVATRIKLGIDYYHGLSDIYFRSAGPTATQQLTVTNRFFQFTVELNIFSRPK